MENVAEGKIPEIQHLVLPPAPAAVPAPATAQMNSMKDVSHVTKFNGENFSDYRYEFLIIMEQFGLASLIDASGGQVEVLPTEVKIITAMHM